MSAPRTDLVEAEPVNVNCVRWATPPQRDRSGQPDKDDKLETAVWYSECVSPGCLCGDMAELLLRTVGLIS